MLNVFVNLFLSDRDMVSRVVTALSSELPDKTSLSTAVAIFTMRAEKHEKERREAIMELLANLPVGRLSKNTNFHYHYLIINYYYLTLIRFFINLF